MRSIPCIASLLLHAMLLGFPSSAFAQAGLWSFDEDVWDGTPGEVLDRSGNGSNGSIVGGPSTDDSRPALRGSPGTCRYGEFGGGSDAIEIPHDDSLVGTTALTYAAWINPDRWNGTRQVMAKSVHGGGSGRAQMGIFSEGGLLVGRSETAGGRREVYAPLPATGEWTHVALVFARSTLKIYVNGSQVSSVGFRATSLRGNSDPLAIGKRVGTNQYFFDGSIDEVHVATDALNPSQIRALMSETHSCSSRPVGMLIQHDRTGIHCQPEDVIVSALDGSGNVFAGFGGTITLDTQTGAGNWRLLRGAGRLVDPRPDDGIASYTFAPGDGGVAGFALLYPSGPEVVDVDAFTDSARDDDSEGTLVFAPSGFEITASPLPNPPPAVPNDPLRPQTAGTDFALHLAAFGSLPGDPECGIIESYTGDKALRFWVDHQDPSRAPLVPTIDRRAIASSEGAGSDQMVRFDRGQARVIAKYKDVGRVSIGALDASGLGSGTAVRGQTNGFVSRPADFVFTNIVNDVGVPNPASDEPSEPLFARAGEPFGVTVEVRDAEGDRTPSFGNESIPEGIRLHSASLEAPSGGRNGSDDTGSIANADAFSPSGPLATFAGSTFAFDEVGAIRLEASVSDGDYLGSGPVVGLPSPVVGRFAPSHFELTANSPEFATGCGVGAFTWIGQPFVFTPGLAPEITVRAVAAGGNTTENYAGDWWRITNDSLANRSYRAGGLTLDTSGLPPENADPTITSAGDGTGTLRFSAGTGLVAARITPIAPLDLEIETSIDVLDLDGTAYPTNPFTIGDTTTGLGIDFDVAKRFRFGRLRIDNGHGSEIATLALNLRTQYFDGTVFADDADDSCSTIPVTSLALTPAPIGLSTTPSLTHVPLFGGQGGLSLTAPGDEGTVDIVVELGATGANLPWLRFDWPEDGNLDGLLDDDPRARATFGIWEGRQLLIYQREVF